VQVFGGPARDLVHALKYDGLSAVAPLMAQGMTERLQAWAPEVDAVVPVPVAGVRKRRRGYNQAELLAREISRATGVRVVGAAISRRPGPSQIEQPDEDARRKNAREAFAPGRTSVSGAVLLVDDVMTTGATLDACARVLKSAGAERVYGLTFARES
jgi:ComF family protein